MTGLPGKVVLVTGASRGSGRAHCVRFAEEGADVLALDFPEAADELHRTATEVQNRGRRCATGLADVADLSALTSVIDAGVAQLGRLDVIIANAGIHSAGAPSWELDPQVWQHTLDINLTGVWHTVKAALPHMTTGGGSIILVSSMLGIRGGGYMAHYASAKHAVVGLMNSLANELAPQWIRVNSIHPGNILTPMLDNEQFCRTLRPDLPNPTVHDAGKIIGQFHLLPKPLIEARAVSNAVLFLASDEAQYITGAALPVDAGAVAKF